MTETHDHDDSCHDYGISRRNLLRSAGVVGMAGVATSMFGDVLTSTAFGATTTGNVLVVLSLRGGADGLSMVVPHAETEYYKARPNTAIKVGELLGADSQFGLHPSFAKLLPWWQNGQMAALHAVGLPVPNRSHFEAMELVEDADPGSAERVGWLNRMIGCFTRNDLFDGVQLGTTVMPTSLIGPEPAVATSDFQSLSVPWGNDKTLGPRMRAALGSMYKDPGTVIGRAGVDALALDTKAGSIATIEKAGAQNGATYPNNSLGKALASSAALIRSGVGVRAIAVDFGGWDNHVDLSWRVSNQIKDMSAALAAFLTDLGTDASRVTVVTLSEFGRRLAQNGAAGVDHGYGNAVLAIGAGVKGGKYYANWPTLDPQQQLDGDLKVTTDYRCVLAEILERRFGSEVGVGTVFPGLGSQRLGFMA